jgi:transcriptional regulator with XRE-family HTH domain
VNRQRRHLTTAPKGIAVRGDTDGSELFEDEEFQQHYEDAQSRSRLLISLVHCRSEKGLAQRTVARFMGTTQSAISQLESGETDPRLSTLQRYARAVGARVFIHLNVYPGIPGDPSEWPTLDRGQQIGSWAGGQHASPFQDALSYRYISEAGPVDEASVAELKVG